MNMFLGLLYAFFTVAIPGPGGALPPGVATYVSMALEYMLAGTMILNAYIDLGYLLILYGIIFSFDVSIMAFRFVMFILRKIPFLGIR